MSVLLKLPFLKTILLRFLNIWRLLDKVIYLCWLLFALSFNVPFVWTFRTQCFLWSIDLFWLFLLANRTHELICCKVWNLRLKQFNIILILTMSRFTHSKWYHLRHFSHSIISAVSSADLHKQYNFIGSTSGTDYWGVSILII